MAQVFSGEFCEISQKTLLHRRPPVAASITLYFFLFVYFITFSSFLSGEPNEHLMAPGCDTKEC